VPMSGDLKQNRILAALPDDEFDRMQSLLRIDSYPSGKTLYDTGENISNVYFVNTGMISLVSMTDEGASIEVGVIGQEGMLGISAILGFHRMPQKAIVQLPLIASKMSLKALANELSLRGKLQGLLMRQMYLLHFQVARSVLCNRFHHIESRLCRWLLMSRERVVSDQLPLTQEFIATMLGVARPMVSLTARTLQTAGLIDYKSGLITILDIKGLEAASCDCYQIVRDESTRFSESR